MGVIFLVHTLPGLNRHVWIRGLLRVLRLFGLTELWSSPLGLPWDLEGSYCVGVEIWIRINRRWLGSKG